MKVKVTCSCILHKGLHFEAGRELDLPWNTAKELAARGQVEIIEDAPVKPAPVVESPVIEAPVVEETLVVEESPVVEDAPVVEEMPVVETVKTKRKPAKKKAKK